METSQKIEAEPALALDTVRLARMGDRVIAVFLDGIILFPFFILGGSCVASWNGEYDNGSYSLQGGPALLAIACAFVIWIVYHIIGEWEFSGTLGKHIMGIEVRSSNKRPVTAFQAVIRNLLLLIDAIGFYLLGFLVAIASKNNQRVGDKMADTIVTEKIISKRGRAVLLSLSFFVLGFLANFAFLYLAAR